MKEFAWFSFIVELLLASTCLFFGFEKHGINSIVAYLLIVACILAAKLLVELIKTPLWLSWGFAIACVAVVFFYGTELFLPIAAVLLADALLRQWGFNASLAITLVTAVLLGLILPQIVPAIIATLFGIVLLFTGFVITQNLVHARNELALKDERIAALELRLENQRATINKIEQQGRQAERNRLAARIHDQVGHGMTGSILMLEAAQLQVDKNPEQAAENISKATENLRESVDEIRRELREERNAHESASLKRISEILDEFSSSHEGIAAELKTQGSLETVPQAIWLCVQESLLETLTNLLKHSQADRFTVAINLRNRFLLVEFNDNGFSGLDQEVIPVQRGIGLANIEERVLLNSGKIFFAHQPQGFRTRMTFVLKGRI